MGRIKASDLPKITGLLHNCTLNCALPTLLENIDILADMETGGKLSAISNNPVIESYDLLKDLFANYYGVSDKEKFNYQQFSNFLLQFSFYAKEIVFAPVLREFMAKKCKFARDIPYTTALQADGSYNDLQYSDAYHLFYKYFGICVTIYEFKNSNNYDQVPYKPYNDLPSFRDIVYPFQTNPTLSLYFKNAHYELQPHEDLAKKASELYNNEERELPTALSIAHHSISCSDSIRSTHSALEKVKIAIQLMIKEQFETPQLNLAEPIEPHSRMQMCNLSMQVLGGFIIAIGAITVALAFTVLSVATLGASLGFVAILIGVGLFATGTYKNCTTPDDLNYSEPPSRNAAIFS